MSLEKLFLDYMFEEYECECIYDDQGFAFFAFVGEECHIRDFKSTGKGLELFHKVVEYAWGKKMKWITACVTVGGDREEKGSRLVKGYLAKGFKILNATNGHVVLKYDIDKAGVE